MMNPPKQHDFEVLVKQHQDSIYRICQAYGYYQNFTDDLYQEVLIHLWRSLKNFRGEAQLSTWLYRVTVNTAITFNRKEKRFQEMHRGDLPSADQTPQDLSERENRITEENQLQQLHRAIAQLPPEERLLMGLYLEDVSYKEMAEILGMTVNLVGVKINRIKQRISRQFTAVG